MYQTGVTAMLLGEPDSRPALVFLPFLNSICRPLTQLMSHCKLLRIPLEQGVVQTDGCPGMSILTVHTGT